MEQESSYSGNIAMNTVALYSRMFLMMAISLYITFNLGKGDGARLQAATWGLHCSVFSFAVGLVSVPYNAEIIAHEKMDIYAHLPMVP